MKKIRTLGITCATLGLSAIFSPGLRAQDNLEIPVSLPPAISAGRDQAAGANRRANNAPVPQDDDLAIGLRGHQMVNAENRRAVMGGGAFRRHGEVPVGNLAAGKAGEDARQVLALRDLNVMTHIEGVCARTTVTHVFQNDTDAMLEGVFSFGVPHDAVVDRFAMTIQSESDLMEGELVDRTTATNVYSTLVYGQGVDPGKLEWVGNNVFRATIFPIPSKRTKTIVVSYLQPLNVRVNYDGSRELTYTYAVTPDGQSGAARMRFDTCVDGLPGAKVSSSIGDFSVGIGGSLLLSKTFDATKKFEGRDFQISMKMPRAPKDQDGNCWVQAHRPKMEKDGYLALTLVPDMGLPPAVGAVDAIFMLDTSASRSQAEHHASIQLIVNTLKNLDPNDRFGVMAYDITTQAAPGGMQKPTPENIAAVEKFLNGIRPLGATDVAGAFDAVAKTFKNDESRPRRIVFIGDTRASFGAKKSEEIRAAAERAMSGPNIEMHCVCSSFSTIDNAEARTQFNELSLFGAPVMKLSSIDRMDLKGAELSERMNNQYLRQAKVIVEYADGTQLKSLIHGHAGAMPANLGSVLYGTYERAGDVTVKLSGIYGGQKYTREWKVTLPPQTADNAPIAKLWALAQISNLESSGVSAEASNVAKEYKVMSRGTAFLVLESEKMYADFNIARGGNKNVIANRDELRARFMAGTPVLKAMTVTSAVRPEGPLAPDAVRGIHVNGPQNATSRNGGVDVAGVSVEVSLQRVNVSEKQSDGVFLDRYARLERRLGLSRLIAAERMLPFEPEVVYPTLWLDALSVARGGSRNGVSDLVPIFSPANDEAIWKIVDAQQVKAPAWQTSGRASNNRQANRTIGAIGSNTTFRDSAVLSDRELQLEAFLDPAKSSKIAVAADGLTLQLESHVLAHQMVGAMLTGNDPGLLRGFSGGTAQMVKSRKVLNYSLKSVPPDRLAATYMFLAQLALVEHNREQAEQLADRAFKHAPQALQKDQALNQVYLLKALSAQLRADFAAASKCYESIMVSPSKLTRTGHDLTYRGTVMMMAMSGNIDGMLLALERWAAAENYDETLVLELGKAYLFAGKRETAIRVLSTLAERDATVGEKFKTADEFLKLASEK
jgi:hypothetical protein